MIKMHARHKQTDTRTDSQTDRRTNEHHGNSAMIRSMDASRAKTKGSGMHLKGGRCEDRIISNREG